MPPRYKLFYSPSACSLAPHIVLEELGVLFEPIRVVIAEGANRAPAYLAINPRGRVPTLQIDDGQGTRTLTEAMGIMIYLAQRHPEAQLLDTAPESFARTLEWMSWLGSTLHQTGIRTVLRPERFTTEGADASGIAARGLENVAIAYADLEQRLPRDAYALGSRFTILDAYLLVFYRWGNKIGLNMRERFPRYTSLADHVRARPAVQQVIEREGIDLGA